MSCSVLVCPRLNLYMVLRNSVEARGPIPPRMPQRGCFSLWPELSWFAIFLTLVDQPLDHQNTLRMHRGKAGVARKIRLVEGENMRDAMYVHGGRQSRIMGLDTAYTVAHDQVLQ